eukprot:3202432-Rhodomonas_salina.1
MLSIIAHSAARLDPSPLRFSGVAFRARVLQRAETWAVCDARRGGQRRCKRRRTRRSGSSSSTAGRAARSTLCSRSSPTTLTPRRTSAE